MSSSDRPVAVITGASSGIGAQFARRYAREGFDLVVVARSGDTLEALASELGAAHGIRVDVHVADLRVTDEVAALARKLAAELPRLDHLVNCAGVAPGGDLANADEDELVALVDLNVTALTLLTRAAVVRMRETRAGTIVNVASAAAYQPMPHLAAYGASKSYVLRFTEAVAEENRASGVRILAVSPGDTDTPMNTGPARSRRRPEQVVETTWRALRGGSPSVVDGWSNRVLAALASRVLPTRVALKLAGRMMQDRA